MNEQQILVAARERVAKRLPGCRRAIVSNDPLANWDRGDLVRTEVETVRAEQERDNEHGRADMDAAHGREMPDAEGNDL